MLRHRWVARLSLRQSQLGVSDRRLAPLIGVDSTTFSRWKRYRSSPRLDQLVRLAKVLRCSVPWLLGLPEDGTAPRETGVDPVSYEAGYRAALRDARAALRAPGQRRLA